MEKQQPSWRSNDIAAAETMYEKVAVKNDSPPAWDRQLNADALERAFERAGASKADLLKSPEMVNGEELGRQIGLSRAAIDLRRVAGKLLALEFGSKRGFRFPTWQRDLVLDGHIRGNFERTLERLSSVGSWSRYRFFKQAAPALNGQSPVQALLAGEAETVLRAAETWASGEQGGA